MGHHTGILYLPEHSISISALFSLGRLHVFIDGPSYRYSIPSRTLYLNLSLFSFGRLQVFIDGPSYRYSIPSRTLFQSQPYFLSVDYRYSLMGHHTGIPYLPEHFISISALFSLGRLHVFIDGPSYRYYIPSGALYLNLSLIFLSGDFFCTNILFIVGLLSTFSHSLISVCWHIITLTGHRKSIGINY